MHFFHNPKFKFRLGALAAILLVLGLVILLTACQQKTVIRPLIYERPTTPTTEPTEEEESSQETRKPAKTQETSKKETETTYDMSGEFDPGNLQNLAGGSFKSFAGSENGPNLNALSSAISQFLQERGLSAANISIAYQDLTSNELYTWKADLRYPSASVIKVAAAMVVGQLTDQGYFPADMQIVYLPSKWFSAENMDPGQQGKLVPMSNLVSSALLYSDNAATSAIFGYFDRHGRLLHNFLDERTGTNYAGDISMSAREGIGLITQLYFDSSFPSYQTILSTMTSSTWNEFLTKNIPVAVSSKYGNLPGIAHEIGLVWTDRPFAYAVFSQNIPAYDVLPALGSLLYQYNTGTLAASPSPTEPSTALPTGGSYDDLFTDIPGQGSETFPSSFENLLPTEPQSFENLISQEPSYP